MSESIQKPSPLHLRCIGAVLKVLAETLPSDIEPNEIRRTARGLVVLEDVSVALSLGMGLGLSLERIGAQHEKLRAELAQEPTS